jgi:hypothetical protein
LRRIGASHRCGVETEGESIEGYGFDSDMLLYFSNDRVVMRAMGYPTARISSIEYGLKGAIK